MGEEVRSGCGICGSCDIPWRLEDNLSDGEDRAEKRRNQFGYGGDDGRV